MYYRDFDQCKAIRKQLKHILNNFNDFRLSFKKSIHKIGSGTYNDVFKVSVTLDDDNTEDIVMRLSYYDSHVLNGILKSLDGLITKENRRITLSDKALKHASHLNRVDPVKIKNNYSLVCRSLIQHNICPHYVFIFHYADFRNFSSMVRHLLPEKRLMHPQQEFTNISFHELFTSNLHHCIVHGLIDDRFQIKQIIFQVLFSLFTLQHYLPGFRHNDLSTSNILVKLHDKKHSNARYKVGTSSFLLKNSKVFAAIWDFDLAHAPGRCVRLDNFSEKTNGEGLNLRNYIILQDKFKNYKKDASVQNINDRYNPSFDTYFFLSSFKKSCHGDDRFKEALEFIASVVPFTESEWPTYIDHNVEKLHPTALMNHSYFTEIRSTEIELHQARKEAPCEYGLKPLPLYFMCEAQDGISSQHQINYVGSDIEIAEPIPHHLYVYDKMKQQ